eukprot:8586716-Lingulodinium_polyedra.AAC.1
MPVCAINVACALVAGRSVTARIAGRWGPLRRLRRNIGMGGTAVPSWWPPRPTRRWTRCSIAFR